MRITKRKKRNEYPPSYEICVDGVVIGHAHGAQGVPGWYVGSEYYSVPRLNSWASHLSYDSLASALEGALSYVKRHAKAPGKPQAETVVLADETEYGR
jgi:hypothetical protein